MVIYKITNKINNKYYIGQTIQCVKQRFREHCRKTKNTSIINNAINKYGKDNFTLQIIDTAKTIAELNKKEIFWIKKLKSNKVGYNIEPGGKNCKLAQSTIAKISKTRKRKPVIAVNKITRKKMRFESIAAAVKAGFQESNIIKCCKGVFTNHKNYYWHYANERLSIRKTPNERASKSVIGINLNTKRKITFVSLREASRKGFYRNLITKAIRNNKPYKNYIWRIGDHNADSIK